MRSDIYAFITGKIYLWIVFLTLYSPGHAESSLQFEALSLNQGISHNMVYCIIQDRSGVVWLGSMYGLVRYDGHGYTTYRNDPNDSLSISNNDVISIYEDSNGNLWVGTWGGGLNRYVRESSSFERFLADSSRNAIGGNTIWSIAEVMSRDKRELWFAGAGEGLFRTGLNNENGKRHFDKVELKSDVPVRVIQTVHASSDSLLRVGTNNGIFEIVNGAQTGHIPILTSEKAKRLGIFVRTMFEDDNRRLWVGTSGAGLFVLPPDEPRGEQWRFTSAKDSSSLLANSINAIAQDKRGYIWVGTENGLSRIHSDSLDQGQFLNSYYHPERSGTLSSNHIGSLLSDRSGILWIGSYMGGIDRFIPWKNKFEKLQHDPYDAKSLPGRNVLALTQSGDGRLWVATEGGKLSVSTAQVTGKINSTHFENRSDIIKKALGKQYPVTALVETKDRSSANQMWIGTVNGLLRLENDGATKVFTKENGLTSGSIQALQQGEEAELWIATSNGVNRLDIRTGEIKQYWYDPKNDNSLIHNWTLTLFRDNSGRMWIGSYGGLSMYRRETDDFQNYRHQLDNPQTLPSNYVYAITDAEAGNLWVGTSAGLSRLDPITGSSKNYGLKDGLANIVICGIGTLTDENLWISSHQGISQLNLTSWQIRNFDIHDGLQGNMFNPGVHTTLRDGSILFGGSNGINRISTDTFADKTEPSAVVIQSFSANGQSIPSTQTDMVELDWSKREPVFSFSSLDYTAPEKNKYSWRLRGWKDEWSSPVAKNIASFGKLDAGEYTFEVRGYDSAGNPSRETAGIAFEIIAPFWLQARYQLLAVLVLFILGWYIHRLRLKQQVHQAKLIARARTLERDWIREQTSRDYHDQMGHHLTKISLYSTLVAQSLNGPAGDQQVRSYLGKITDAAQRLGSDSRDFIWALNPQKDTLADLEQHLNDFAIDLFTDSDIEFSISKKDCSKSIVLSMDWRRNVTLIIKEALHNAMKHSNADLVKLEFFCNDEGRIRVSVSDNGKGFNLDHDRIGNGLDNMQSRASKLGAELIIESAAGIGTTVELLAILGETVRSGEKRAVGSRQQEGIEALAERSRGLANVRQKR